MTTPANRFVVGPDSRGRSAALQRGRATVQSQEGFFWRATLCATRETPVEPCLLIGTKTDATPVE